MDQSGEVDYSKCRDEKLVKRLKSKKHIVKEALQWQDLDFGNVHRQQQAYKATKLNSQIKVAYQHERKEFARIQDILRNSSRFKEEHIDKTMADELIGTKFHAFTQKILDDEDQAIHSANLNIDNFLDGGFFI